MPLILAKVRRKATDGRIGILRFRLKLLIALPPEREVVATLKRQRRMDDGGKIPLRITGFRRPH